MLAYLHARFVTIQDPVPVVRVDDDAAGAHVSREAERHTERGRGREGGRGGEGAQKAHTHLR